MKSKIIFRDLKIKKAFLALKDSKYEDLRLYEWINRALEDIEQNAFCGIQIPKKLIPKIYEVNNLWKYNLPNAWRLIYTIANGQICIMSIILEWMTHKEYEKQFKY